MKIASSSGNSESDPAGKYAHGVLDPGKLQRAMSFAPILVGTGKTKAINLVTHREISFVDRSRFTQDDLEQIAHKNACLLYPRVAARAGYVMHPVGSAL